MLQSPFHSVLPLLARFLARCLARYLAPYLARPLACPLARALARALARYLVRPLAALQCSPPWQRWRRQRALPRAMLAAAAVISLAGLSACGGGGASPPQEPPKPAPPPPEKPEIIVLQSTLTPLAAGTAGSVQYFPAGGSGTGQPIAGVGCATSEKYHAHAMVSFYRDGVRLGLPAHIGLNGCTYELHTHEPTTGVIHMETDVPRQFKLGQFFDLWGQPLARSGTAGLAGPVRFYLIEAGKLSAYSGDPAAIELTSHREVLIVTGKAPDSVPQYDWEGSQL